jgi:hypothetical protein
MRMLNHPQLFQKAHEVGLSHQEVLASLEFYGLVKTEALISKALEKGKVLQFFIVEEDSGILRLYHRLS